MGKSPQSRLHRIIAGNALGQLPQQGHNVGLERLELIAQGGIHHPMSLSTMGLDVNFLTGEYIVPQLEAVLRRGAPELMVPNNSPHEPQLLGRTEHLIPRAKGGCRGYIYTARLGMLLGKQLIQGVNTLKNEHISRGNVQMNTSPLQSGMDGETVNGDVDGFSPLQQSKMLVEQGDIQPGASRSR